MPILRWWRRWQAERALQAAFAPSPPVRADASPEIKALAAEMEAALRQPTPAAALNRHRFIESARATLRRAPQAGGEQHE